MKSLSLSLILISIFISIFIPFSYVSAHPGFFSSFTFFKSSEAECKSDDESSSLITFKNPLNPNELHIETVKNQDGEWEGLSAKKIINDESKGDTGEKIKDFISKDDLSSEKGACLVEGGGRCLLNFSSKDSDLKITYLHDAGLRSDSYKSEVFHFDEEKIRTKEDKVVTEIHTIPHYYGFTSTVNGVDKLEIKTEDSQ